MLRLATSPNAILRNRLPSLTSNVPKRRLHLTKIFQQSSAKSPEEGFWLVKYKKHILAVQGVALVGLGWYYYDQQYTKSPHEIAAEKAYQLTVTSLRKLEGMRDTVFHTDFDDITSEHDVYFHASRHDKIGELVRVVFFATMRERKAVVTAEYVVREDGKLAPRVVMATIDANTEHEQFSVLQDNRKITDGDQILGLIAGDEAPEIIEEVEDQTWDGIRKQAQVIHNQSTTDTDTKDTPAERTSG